MLTLPIFHRCSHNRCASNASPSVRLTLGCKRCAFMFRHTFMWACGTMQWWSSLGYLRPDREFYQFLKKDQNITGGAERGCKPCSPARRCYSWLGAVQHSNSGPLPCRECLHIPRTGNLLPAPSAQWEKLSKEAEMGRVIVSFYYWLQSNNNFFLCKNIPPEAKSQLPPNVMQQKQQNI